MEKKEKLKSISKFLSLVLRHEPQAAGITLDEYGWADVDALLLGISQKMPIDRQTLEQIVAEDNKQRYTFDETKTKIRANQGHSIQVDVELQPCVPPDILYHGTAVRFAQSIQEQGILPQSRLYVHLSKDKETAKTVGARHGKPCVYMIDTKRMVADGYVFYLSANGVWLTKCVPPQYFIDK